MRVAERTAEPFVAGAGRPRLNFSCWSSCWRAASISWAFVRIAAAVRRARQSAGPERALDTDSERLNRAGSQATAARVERTARDRLAMRSATPAVTQYVELPALQPADGLGGDAMLRNPPEAALAAVRAASLLTSRCWRRRRRPGARSCWWRWSASAFASARAGDLRPDRRRPFFLKHGRSATATPWIDVEPRPDRRSQRLDLAASFRAVDWRSRRT